MPASYWGATESLGLAWPQSGAAWLLLALYAALIVTLLARGRATWRAFSRRQGFLLAVLILSGFLASNLLPLSLPWQTPLAGDGARPPVALLAAVPYLLAGAILGPLPALLTGLATGLGRALGGSHFWVEPFHYALAAWLAAILLRQRYQGRLYRLLRFPVTAGALSGVALALLGGLAAGWLAPAAALVRLDVALLALEISLPGLLLEGLAGGAILALLLLALPEARPSGAPLPAPGQRSLQGYLATNVLLFGLTSLALSSLFALSVSMLWSTRLHVAELAAAANAATVEIAELQDSLENSLAAFGEAETAAGSSKISARALGQFQRSNRYFEQILFVDRAVQIVEAVPAVGAAALSDGERAAVSRALAARGEAPLSAARDETGQGLSIIVPVSGAGAVERAALIGRVAPDVLREALAEPQQGQRARLTAVLDREGRPLAQSGAEGVEPLWAMVSGTVPALAVPADFEGSAHLLRASSGGRELVYLGPRMGQSWRVGVAMPFADVAGQALLAALPLIVALLAVTGAFYARTTAYGRGLSAPLTELARASRMLAAGGKLPSRAPVARADEIGELDRAFADMHSALRRRLEELSLLLTVSQEAAASIDLNDNMPVILQGAIRGTGATGARAVVLSPHSGFPLTFGDGPDAAALAVLDRPFMNLMREQAELVLRTPGEITAVPALAGADTGPAQALYALRLGGQQGFRGFMLLGFRQPWPAPAAGEQTLLRTLAGQAALLIEKSYLFSNAEGGRRRLAAVLASTAEAVIVTDQTMRILIINRAFEQAFGLQAGQVVGRSVADVVPAAPLVKVMTQPEAAPRDVEVEGRDRRIYFANASPISSHDGQVLGRVAVLHDVTHLKESDRIKSEFVDNVSHDLRTPLTVLSGYASALAMLDDLTPEQRDYSDNILKSVDRLVALVENLLDLGRIEAGVDLLFEPVEVAELLRELADEHWLYARESGNTLEVRAAAGLPPVTADRVLLSQALSNLLMNACKYAPDSGAILLAARPVGNELLFSVHDRGPGIAGQDQMRLFEKFYRVKRHGAGKAKGTGLGLAIVRSIAERHNGRAWCESELGQGSAFFLAIPLQQRQDE